MPNPSKEPSASSQAPNEDVKDMNVLCTFKITIESQNSDHRYIKDQWPRYQDKIWNMGLSETIDHIQIMIKMPNSSQETPTPSEAPIEDLKGMDIIFTFKIKVES